MMKPCEVCGNMIECKTIAMKYCDKCRKDMNNVYSKKYYYKNRESKIKKSREYYLKKKEDKNGRK